MGPIVPPAHGPSSWPTRTTNAAHYQAPAKGRCCGIRRVGPRGHSGPLPSPHGPLLRHGPIPSVVVRAWAPVGSVPVSARLSVGRRGPFLRTACPAPGGPAALGKAPQAARGSVRRGAPAPASRPRSGAWRPPFGRRVRASLAVPPAGPGVCPRPCAPSVPPWALGGPARRFPGRGPVPAHPLSVAGWWSGCGGRGGRLWAPFGASGPGAPGPAPRARPLGRAVLRGGPGRFSPVCFRPLRRGSSGGGSAASMRCSRCCARSVAAFRAAWVPLRGSQARCCRGERGILPPGILPSAVPLRGHS